MGSGTDRDQRLGSRDETLGRRVERPAVGDAGEQPQAREEGDGVHVRGLPGLTREGVRGRDVVVRFENAEGSQMVADGDCGTGVFDDERDRVARRVVLDGQEVRVDDCSADGDSVAEIAVGVIEDVCSVRVVVGRRVGLDGAPQTRSVPKRTGRASGLGVFMWCWWDRWVEDY